MVGYRRPFRVASVVKLTCDDGRVFFLVPLEVAVRIATPLRNEIRAGLRDGIRPRAEVLVVVEEWERARAEVAAEVAEQVVGSDGSSLDDPSDSMPTMSTAAAALVIDRSDRHVRQLLRDGVLDGNKSALGWRVDESSVAEYLARRARRERNQ